MITIKSERQSLKCSPNSRCSTAARKRANEATFGLKQKIVTVILLTLMSTALLVLPFSNVLGQSPTGFNILQVTLQGSFTAITSGSVDDPINVIATQYTPGGPYKMWFGDTLVDNNTSTGYYISSNFTIPEVPAGNYTITLLDVTIDQNATFFFDVKTSYIAQPVVPIAPAQLQEGSNLVLNVSITGGQPNTAYAAEITVTLPTSLPASNNANYSRTISFTSSSKGTANAQLAFPDASFQPSGSATIYVGLYSVLFNATQNLAQDQFAIGLTDQTVYHRGDSVKIHAAGYSPGQTGVLAIQLQGGGAVFSQTVTANDQGAISASWSVPSSVVLGEYNVTITPQTNPKAIFDTQIFSVPGFPVGFRALNLAGEAVPGILVEALDKASTTKYNGTTGDNGVTSINIEEGNYTVNTYWNQVNVGELQIAVSGNSSYDIQCRLTDLRVNVQDKNGNAIPFVNIGFSFQYTTRTGETQTGSFSVQTDGLGVYAFNSTLPGINYVVEASKYNVVFNGGNNTVTSLPAQPAFQVTVICPDETLSLKTLDYNLAALPNARIELIEQASGIFYSATTDNTGSTTVQVTFGQYRLRVYTAENILLNETVVGVLSNTQSQIVCSLYNLQVTVMVLDYFGNPISNANVELSRPGMNTQSATTQGDGTVTFNNVIGGAVEITAYPAGNPNSFAATNLQINEPMSVEIKIEKYAALGPILMETSMLAALIIILIAIILFAGIEIYKWKGFKLRRKSES